MTKTARAGKWFEHKYQCRLCMGHFYGLPYAYAHPKCQSGLKLFAQFWNDPYGFVDWLLSR